jgi:hypothetical protein
MINAINPTIVNKTTKKYNNKIQPSNQSKILNIHKNILFFLFLLSIDSNVLIFLVKTEFINKKTKKRKINPNIQSNLNISSFTINILINCNIYHKKKSLNNKGL